MSTTSRMTIAWDRLDQMALFPPDSSEVTPPPVTTIAWTPLLGPTIFDYDPSDLLVTPGAGEEAATPPGGGGKGTGGAPGGGATSPRYGHPQLTVAHRRSLELFLRDGLDVHLETTAPAQVRAVLQTKAKGKKGKAHLLNLSKVLDTRVEGGQGKLTLHPSRGGRISLHRLKGSISATLVLVVNYGNGQKPVQLRRHVTIVG
ncbi:MAG TPA: hypothetical protein VHA80_05315 [Solirubrobacterales bacterium]|nr:hypothetical protein [Solirubrobacterales bacterium]